IRSPPSAMSEDEPTEASDTSLTTETRRHRETRLISEKEDPSERVSSIDDPASPVSVSLCLRGELEGSSPAPLTAMQTVSLLSERQGDLISRELTVLQEQGRSVSCRAGCAACCRQFVVVSPLD